MHLWNVLSGAISKRDGLNPIPKELSTVLEMSRKCQKEKMDKPIKSREGTNLMEERIETKD